MFLYQMTQFHFILSWQWHSPPHTRQKGSKETWIKHSHCHFVCYFIYILKIKPWEGRTNIITYKFLSRTNYLTLLYYSYFKIFLWHTQKCCILLFSSSPFPVYLYTVFINFHWQTKSEATIPEVWFSSVLWSISLYQRITCRILYPGMQSNINKSKGW